MVLHLTEWTEYRQIDPAALLSVVRAPRILDGRNVLPLGNWQAVGWTVQSMGAARPSASCHCAPALGEGDIVGSDPVRELASCYADHSA